MKKLAILLLLILGTQSYAQMVVTGRVVDATTKQALPNSNVYVNNTSMRTFTDNEGKFKLVVPKAEKTELIISHLSYKKRAIVVAVGKGDVGNIEMAIQETNLDEIIIKSKRKGNTSAIKEWIEIFSINLIGNYKGVATQCKIKNPEALYFDYDTESKDLKVFAKEPIEIENSALGYLIRLELDDCVYNLLTEEVVFRYSAFFENLVMPRPKILLALNKRKLLYQGSKMHFLRSLFEGNVEQQGFSIYKYNSIKYAERVRVSQKLQNRISEVYPNEVNPKVDVSRLFSVPDTLRYFGEVMARDEVLRVDTTRLSPMRVSKVNNELNLVNFNSPDTLMIRFRGQDVSKAKLIKDWYSYISFIKKGGINVQPNGFYPELGVLVDGDMGNRRMAGMLPFDFDPKKEEL